MAGLISNGTYVLGDPNTRDLYIGNGLKQGITSDGKQYIAADETVLWEGEELWRSNPTITLSESISNFETIKIFNRAHDTNTMEIAFECTTDFVGRSVQPMTCLGIPGDGGVRINSCGITTTGDTITLSFAKQSSIQGTTVSTATCPTVITKIVGINRKEGN